MITTTESSISKPSPRAVNEHARLMCIYEIMREQASSEETLDTVYNVVHIYRTTDYQVHIIVDELEAAREEMNGKDYEIISENELRFAFADGCFAFNTIEERKESFVDTYSATVRRDLQLFFSGLATGRVNISHGMRGGSARAAAEIISSYYQNTRIECVLTPATFKDPDKGQTEELYIDLESTFPLSYDGRSDSDIAKVQEDWNCYAEECQDLVDGYNSI